MMFRFWVVLCLLRGWVAGASGLGDRSWVYCWCCMCLWLVGRYSECFLPFGFGVSVLFVFCAFWGFDDFVTGGCLLGPFADYNLVDFRFMDVGLWFRGLV